MAWGTEQCIAAICLFVVCPSVCLSHGHSSPTADLGLRLLTIEHALIGNPVLHSNPLVSVQPYGHRKWLQRQRTPLRRWFKHSLVGCGISMPTPFQTAIGGGAYRFTSRCLIQNGKHKLCHRRYMSCIHNYARVCKM